MGTCVCTQACCSDDVSSWQQFQQLVHSNFPSSFFPSRSPSTHLHRFAAVFYYNTVDEATRVEPHYYHACKQHSTSREYYFHCLARKMHVERGLKSQRTIARKRYAQELMEECRILMLRLGAPDGAEIMQDPIHPVISYVHLPNGFNVYTRDHYLLYT